MLRLVLQANHASIYSKGIYSQSQQLHDGI